MPRDVPPKKPPVTVPEPAPIPINITSMYGAENKRGLVKIQLAGQDAYLDPDQAREVAQWIIEAAEAAASDEYLMTLAQEQLGMSLQEAHALLLIFRRSREIRTANRRAKPTKTA